MPSEYKQFMPIENRYPRSQLWDAAHVIVMIMSDYQVIDLANAGSLRRRNDALRIASAAIVVPGIDQHGLSGRRNEEHGLAALHVDRKYPQRLTCKQAANVSSQSMFIKFFIRFGSVRLW